MMVWCVAHGFVENWPNAKCNYSHGSCWYPDVEWSTADRFLAGRLIVGRSLWYVPMLGADFRLDDGRVMLGDSFGPSPRDLEEGNLIGSEMGFRKGYHMPVIDLDVPHTYVPSSTEGHGHLYINTVVPWPKYEPILRALADAEVIGWAEYVRAVDREGTFVRKPGKGKTEGENHRMEFRAFLKVFMRLWWRALRKELRSEREWRRAQARRT